MQGIIAPCGPQAVYSAAKFHGALVASYTIKHNSDVPLLTEKTDTYTALALEYSF